MLLYLVSTCTILCMCRKCESQQAFVLNVFKPCLHEQASHGTAELSTHQRQLYHQHSDKPQRLPEIVCIGTKSIVARDSRFNFSVVLQEAATKLGLGITTLKRVCRSNGMTRWPFRKRNSLGRLIDRTKQVLDDGTGQDNMKKLMALQMLEKQRQVMRVGPLSLLWPLQSPDVL